VALRLTRRARVVRFIFATSRKAENRTTPMLPNPDNSCATDARQQGTLRRQLSQVILRLSHVPRAGHEQVAKEISNASEPVSQRAPGGEAFA
jgi:hypothetical protein